ncbi:YdcF family protein [Chitinasiproducens palmae]|uniref:DUF218 domain-containing protein n=1 Tax=Chitinasiproducens palmae TaxID=1770053 RepID=A0A1H2PVF6_9BURK|nr:YdcF family protein [Chitinasiproducens palmae]SDV51300.1 DUF218 domain-containing protein [Chitinasiproducens palmae]
MAGIGIALLALAAVLCGWRGLRAPRNVLAGLAVAALLLCGSGLAPWLLLDKLQDGYRGVHRIAWRADNVIVLLGAGNVRSPVAGQPLPGTMAYSRMLAALALYRQCTAGRAGPAGGATSATTAPPASATTAAAAPVVAASETNALGRVPSSQIAAALEASAASGAEAADAASGARDARDARDASGAKDAKGAAARAGAAPTDAAIPGELPGAMNAMRMAARKPAATGAASAPRRCTVMVSGGDPQRLGRSEAAVYADYLLAAGVAPADLKTEPTSRNTRENAHHVAALLARDTAVRESHDANRPVAAPRNGADAAVDANAPQLVLVTSAFHMRRALLDFAHFGVGPIPVASDRVGPRASPLAFDWNLAMTDVALVEYLGIARYFVYGALGWNPPPGPPAVDDAGAR